jgi:flagellar motor switch protein FliM
MGTLAQSPSTRAESGVVVNDGMAPDRVQPCDFRVVGGIDKARLAPLVAASETFAPRFTQALHARLGLTCETTLRSSEQVPCRTFIEKSGSSYMVSLLLGSQSDIALLQIDSMLLFPIVDRLLGGSGGPSELAREVTEIEDQIARAFVQLICQELQAAWQFFNVPVAMGTRQSMAQMQRMFSANDNALVFGFAANMESSGGDFQVMLPVPALGAFLGVTTASAPESSRKGTMNPRLAEQLLGASFGLELALLGGRVPANDLLNLRVGKILSLGVSARTPAVLKIEGRGSFAGVPVRSGRHRGVQLLDRLPESQPEKENKI